MARLFEEENHANFYFKYRPVFPNALFEEIIKFYDAGKGKTCNRDLAVDVGCGNGQSTLPLGAYFKKVIGCDISKAQIELAKTDAPNISYKVGPAEDMSFIESESTDLITVVTALHWFDLDRFYAEVKRTLKPGGVLAVATYKLPAIEPKEVKGILFELYDDILGPYWDVRRQLWIDHYKTVPSPFENWTRIEPDDIKLIMDVSADDFVGFAQSWHAWHGYLRANPNSQELEKWRQKVEQTYRGKTMKLAWPVFVMMCRKPLS